MLTVAIDAARAPLGPKQRRFNQLVAKVAQLKSALQAWGDARAEIHRGIGELRRIADLIWSVGRETAICWDQQWAKLTKRERNQLSEIIAGAAWDLLCEREDDVTLKALFTKHARTDFDAERAEDKAVDAELLRATFADHGIHVDDSLATPEEVEAAARAQLAEQDRIAAKHARAEAEAEASRRTHRKQSARQRAAELRRESSEREVSKALQDVYRQLAIALHPDLEQDPAERARKTALMQQVNVAYEQRDLLQLLELQLRFEQLDPAAIHTLAEDRLHRFNKLLTEQVAQLKAELADVELPYRMQLNLSPSQKLAPARVLAALREDLRSASNDLSTARHQLAAFADLGVLASWLRERHEDELVRDALLELEMLVMSESPAPRRKRKRRS